MAWNGLLQCQKNEICRENRFIYLKIMEHKKIPVEAMKKLPMPMNLIKIMPESYDLLDSDLKKDGFGNRQHLDV